MHATHDSQFPIADVSCLFSIRYSRTLNTIMLLLLSRYPDSIWDILIVQTMYFNEMVTCGVYTQTYSLRDLMFSI
jgi:hypothetical protein